MYYAMMRSTTPGRWLGRYPFLKGVKWRVGATITVPVPDPIETDLKPFNPQSADHSPNMPALLAGNCPVWRDDLVEAMRSFGVTNLQLFNTAVRDPDNGKVYTNYKSVNILGLMAAADMGKSQATVHPGGPALLDVDFDKLVVDESKTHDALIFRLAESTGAILVHERLRDFLVGKNFDDVVFHDPKEVAL
jgi:hypothetical protein